MINDPVFMGDAITLLIIIAGMAVICMMGASIEEIIKASIERRSKSQRRYVIGGDYK